MLYGKVQLKVLCVDEKTTARILLKDKKKTSSMINCIDNKQNYTKKLHGLRNTEQRIALKFNG